MEPAENQGQPPSEPGSNGSNGNGAHHAESAPEIPTANSIAATLEPPEKPAPKRLTTTLPESDGLTDMQRKFVRAYLVRGDSTQAAEYAGYKWPREMGYQVLQSEEVQRQINYGLLNKNISPLQADAGVAELCYTSLGYFLDDDGGIDIEKLKANAHLVSWYKCRRHKKLSTGEVTVTDVEIKLHDRLEALKEIRQQYRGMAGSGRQQDGGQTAQTIINLVVMAAEQELPKELAGRLLIALGEKMKTVKG